MASGARVIGGVFGLGDQPNPTHSAPAFLSEDAVLLANARSGLWLLAQALAPGQVWLPSFACQALYEAVDRRAARVRFYPVDARLTIPSLDWLADVRRDDLVVLIDYFGWPCDTQTVAAIQERGAWALEDACQALLSSQVGRAADFVLYSPRKFLGVPDGGILIARRPAMLRGAVDLVEPPADWWQTALAATRLRREFDHLGGDRRWFELFQQSEAGAPCAGYAMSKLARELLARGFDYAAIARRRVANYRRLAERLGAYALMPAPAPEVVPLGFPVRLRNRDQVRAALFAQEIYPPVHWPTAGWVPEQFADSHRLAGEIMTLPCDQRYGVAEMDRIADVVLRGGAQ